MKKSVKIVLVSFVFGFIFVNAFGQPPMDGKFRQRGLDSMKIKLNLTEEQSKKIDSIHKAYEPKIEKIHEEAKKVHEQIDAEMKVVLTPEQYQKLQEVRKENRGNMKHKGQKGLYQNRK